MNENRSVKTVSSVIRNSISFKIISIIILILILLIPSSMIKSLIRERESRKHVAVNEISSKWGHEQTITGPIISIPYKKYSITEKGKNVYTTNYMHFLPYDIDINSEVLHEMRYRGMYEAVLYKTRIILAGRFSYPKINEMNIPLEHVDLSSAFISIGISDMRGIKDQIVATFNNAAISMNPGIETNAVISSGISSKIEMPEQEEPFEFKFIINMNGSHRISFIPVGKTTTVLMKSTWPAPSFDGAYLPRKRSITKDGFNAEWVVLHLNRNYPQYWTGNRYKLKDSAFGVKLYIPIDIYQKSMRTTKYAIMFIVLTFMAFFIPEVMNKSKVHPIQYLLIGLAITIFYSLLISISEHISFNMAYFLSSLSVIALITGYSKSILRNNRLSAMAGGILIVLYASLYILLQLEDYALVMGSVGLFTVLGVIMYLTRKIDWYSIKLEG